MRKLYAGVVLFLLILLPFTAAAQDVADRIRGDRIAVLPFVNDTGVEEFDRVADALTDSLRLILYWSRQYDVRQFEAFDPFRPDGRTQMARQARDQRMRAVVFGRIVELAGGRIELEVAVYGTEEGRILGGDSRVAFGAFDLVEASDELLLATTSALLGYPVELGAIIFSPSRGDVAYEVYIDGASVGENIRALPQVLAGRRRVEIMIRTTEGEFPVYSADRLVRSGEALEVAFSLPAVTRMEQSEILLRQSVASRLLGEPKDFPWALEALSESRKLLDQADQHVFQPLLERQDQLETIWRLEREFAELDPKEFGLDAPQYPNGDPLAALPIARRVGASQRTDDRRITERVLRNGYIQYHLTWLRWAEALSQSRWDDADRILDDLVALERHYGIGQQNHWRAVHTAYNEAREEAGLIATRRRRPWPYITLGIGFSGVGFGGYLLATDEVSSHSGSDAEMVEWIQWGSIAAGSVITVASIARIVSNNRAEEAFLREWARVEHGRLIDTAEKVFDPSSSPDDSNTHVLILGPIGELITIGSRVETLPLLIDAEQGSPVRTSRAPVVPDDATRLLTPGTTIFAVE